MKTPRFAAFAIVAICLSVLLGCGGAPVKQPTTETPMTDAPRETVTVLVAASAADAVREFVEESKPTADYDVEIGAGPSNGLAQQILSGAPADLFLSASEEWADALEEPGHVGERIDLLTNRLVLVVPKGNPAGVEAPEDLLSDEVARIAIAGENVPAGKYAEQALTSLNLLEQLKGTEKFARGHDVRATLAFVERAEAEAGIVYATDALTADVETVVAFDASSHDPIRYPLVLLKVSKSKPAAEKFYEALQSPEATAVFERHGFESLVSPSADVESEPAAGELVPAER